MNFFEIEKDLSNGDFRLNQPIVITNYSYDPRLYLQPAYGALSIVVLQGNRIARYFIAERQYTTSNMDDLIDSMARRQLASRRFNVSREHRIRP